MTFQKEKKLHTPASIYTMFMACFFLIFILLSGGCSMVSSVGKQTKHIVKDLYTADSGLKKKVGISVFENKTKLTAREFKENYLNYFSDRLNAECSKVLFVKPEEDGYADILREPPRLASGFIDNLAYAESGRNLGLNAIIRGALVELSSEQEKRGILWFKENRNYIQIRIHVEVYDTETGAKLLDENLGQKVEVEVDVEDPDSETVRFDAEAHKKEFNEALEKTAADMAEAVCEAVLRQPWRGYVTSVHDGKITISAGSKVGLKAGQTLEVYGSGETIQGAQGRQFYIPGTKVGEVKITAVNTETSEAEIVTGEPVKPGSSLRMKE